MPLIVSSTHTIFIAFTSFMNLFFRSLFLSLSSCIYNIYIYIYTERGGAKRKRQVEEERETERKREISKLHIWDGYLEKRKTFFFLENILLIFYFDFFLDTARVDAISVWVKGNEVSTKAFEWEEISIFHDKASISAA